MKAADLQKLLRPVLARIRALAARASLTRVDDSGLSQQVQITVLAGERLDQVVRLQNFGLSANPPAGSTALLISLGGSRTHCVVLGADHASRPRDLLSGESQQYNQWGDCVYLRESGETLVKSRTKVLLDAPLTETTGDMKVGGNFEVVGTSTLTGAVSAEATISAAGEIHSDSSVSDSAGDLAEMRSVFNAHTQTVTAGVAQPPSVPMS